MKLNIKPSNRFFKAHSVTDGRIISKFFHRLARNIFNQSYRYWCHSEIIGGIVDLSLLYKERNLYSTIAVAIDKLTPVHLTEWSFSKLDNESLDDSRRVDFWCLYKDGQHGKPVNVFLEVKKGWYCLNAASQESFHCNVHRSLNGLLAQIETLKSTSLNWGGFNDAFLGMFVVHGFYTDGKEYYDETHIIKNLRDMMREYSLEGCLLLSTWYLPADMNVQWETNKCRFITIACIVQHNAA